MILTLLLASTFAATITLSEKKDPLEVTLHVEHPENTTLETEGLSNRLTTNLFNENPPFKLINEDLNHLKFTLKPLKEGKYPITFYEISFLSQEGKKTTIASPLLFVTIPSKGNQNSMRLVRGAVLIGLPVIYIGLSTLMLLSFYTPRPLTEEEVRERSKQTALKTINRLSTDTPSKPLVKSLVTILKTCLNLPNTKTTEEILTINQNEKVASVLKASDLVTFADSDLSKEEKQDLIQKVKSMI